MELKGPKSSDDIIYIMGPQPAVSGPFLVRESFGTRPQQ